VAGDPWDPARYERFRDERAAPFRALLAGIAPCPGGLALDLGCGTGALTAELHTATGAHLTVGIDASESMLVRARTHADGGGLAFVRADLAAFAPRAPVDLVASNAALHWLADHARLLPRLLEWLAPGGGLAVQVPSNDAHASHRVAREVAAEEPFRSALGGFVRESPVLAPEEYAALLSAAGAVDVRAETRVFEHVMESPAGVVGWIRGTTLTAYERRLDAATYAAFLRRYEERLLAELPDERPYVYGFRRTFVWCRAPR
jgi:trans-aconitate 2-methyltransferase